MASSGANGVHSPTAPSVPGEKFPYTLKAGPAGGRLRRPSSRRQRHNGNREPASPNSHRKGAIAAESSLELRSVKLPLPLKQTKTRAQHATQDVGGSSSEAGLGVEPRARAWIASSRPLGELIAWSAPHR
jgi:hypothetical protein